MSEAKPLADLIRELRGANSELEKTAADVVERYSNALWFALGSLEEMERHLASSGLKPWAQSVESLIIDLRRRESHVEESSEVVAVDTRNRAD